MGNLRRTLLVLLVSTSVAALANGVIPPITNMDQIAKDLKLETFKGTKFTRKIKLAILDNGFSGYETEVGKSLPKSTDYHPGKESNADKRTVTSLHGTLMAKLAAEIIVKSGAEADYELHLFNAYGITKFEDAVSKVIEGGFDVVLYSQVWEFGGNSDSKGFINAVVDKAVAAGVIWINAAGNFGRLTRVGPVDGKVDGEDEWVVFNNKVSDGVMIKCKAPKGAKCQLRLVLSWNDFKDDATKGTDKDLDLFLLDKQGKVVKTSEFHQKLELDLSDDQSSKVPRELIETEVGPGLYKARVKVKSKNFSASQDQLRMTASGPGVELVDPSVDETILPPADNPGAVVIGASDDVQTSISKKMNLPSVYLKSKVLLKDGSAPFSTSVAASMAAGLTVLNLGTGTEKTRDAVLEKLKQVTRTPEKKPEASSTSGASSSGAGRKVPSEEKKPEEKSAEVKEVKKDRNKKVPVVSAPPAPAEGKEAGGSVKQRGGIPSDGGLVSRPPSTTGAPVRRRGSEEDTGYSGEDNGNYGPRTGFDQGPPNYVGGQSRGPVPPRRAALPPYGPAQMRGSCNILPRLPFPSPMAEQVLSRGGASVVANVGGRIVITVNYDFAATMGMPLLPGQRIFIAPNRILVLDPSQIALGLPPQLVEVLSNAIAVCQ